jgi:hypothetical protein
MALVLPNEYIYHRWSVFGFESRHDFMIDSEGKNHKVNRIFEEYFWKYLCWDLFLIIIYFRLWISLEPLIYIIIHFFVIQALLFNKFLIFVYFIGLFLNLSKIIILIGDENFNQIKDYVCKNVSEHYYDLDSTVFRLWPTYRNAKLCAFWIVSTLDEKAREKYKKTRRISDDKIGYKSDHFWQLGCEYYGFDDYKTHMPQYLERFLTIYKSRTAVFVSIFFNWINGFKSVPNKPI